MLISFGNADLVVAGSKIQLGEVSSISQLVKQISDQEKRVPVLDSKLVQGAVVYAHP